MSQIFIDENFTTSSRTRTEPIKPQSQQAIKRTFGKLVNNNQLNTGSSKPSLVEKPAATKTATKIKTKRRSEKKVREKEVTHVDRFERDLFTQGQLDESEFWKPAFKSLDFQYCSSIEDVLRSECSSYPSSKQTVSDFDTDFDFTPDLDSFNFDI